MAGGVGASWPAPRAVADANPQNIKECLRAIKINSEAIIGYIDQYATKTNTHIPKTFKNIVNWCEFALEMPGDASIDEVNTKFNRILSRMENMHQDVSKSYQELKQSPTINSRPGPTVTSWAAVAAKHLPDQPVPPSLTRVHSDGTGTSATTPGASPSDLNKDCEVIIKLGNPKSISTYRGKQPSEIKKIFNLQAQKAARDGAKALLMVHAITAQQLKSGDIAIRLRSAAEAETTRKFKDQWLPRFGREAYLQTYLHGVLVHGVPYASLDSMGGLELKDQGAIIRMLQAHNDYRWGSQAEIVRIRWLKEQLDSKKKASSIIIEFTDPEPANAAIHFGVNWDSRGLAAEKYHHEARIKQCFQCQKFGHIGTQCQNKPVCTYCAQDHPTRSCPRHSGKSIELKCANCHKVGHPARSRRCELYGKELEKAEQAKIHGGRFYREPLRRQQSNPSSEPSSGGSLAGPLGSQESMNSYLGGYSVSQPEASQTVPSTSISGGLSVPTGGEISGDEVMQEGDNLPIDSDPEFTPVPVPKRGRGRPPSNKTTKAVLRAKSKPTPPLRAVTRRQREEEVHTHVDIKSRLNNGSAVRRLRSRSNPLGTPTGSSLGTTPRDTPGSTPGDDITPRANAVAVGDARAADHEALVQNGGMLPPPIVTPKQAHKLADILHGNQGEYRLVHNRDEEYPMQGTSSMIGDSSP
jgi:hypothetical protein